jgi:hypothetical protein
MKSILYLAIAWLLWLPEGSAQTVTTRMGTFDAGGVTEYSQYLYVGPGAHVTIPTGQQWTIASQYILIAPTAVIDGGGQMIIDDPGNFGTLSESVSWTGQPTTVDGGGSQILANVVHRNPNNILLGAVSLVGSAASDGIAANTNHTFYIGTSFAWALTHGDASAITGNDVLLGNNDFRFAASATETGYRETRFAVTNGTGHVVKDSYTGNWIFPVGIAEGDYTPTAINNTSANGMHVLVQDYATSASVEAGANGMNRTWNIYADNAAGNSTLNLEHNLSTNQANFNNNSYFITRWSSTTPNTTGQTTLSTSAWQSNNLGAGTTTGSLTSGAAIANASERTLAYTNFATGAGDPIAFYSKSSNPVTPLPVQLLSFTGQSHECVIALSWNTATEISLAEFQVQYSKDGLQFSTIGSMAPRGGGSVYHFDFRQPAQGKGYYRLQMQDINGAISYSGIVSLYSDCAGTADITLAPNPTSGIAYLRNLNGSHLLKLFAGDGRLVTEQRIDGPTAVIDITMQPVGMYHVVVADMGGNPVFHAPLLKQ